MRRVFIRCDASLLIGSGHVMRCRTLARELKRSGAEVIFLSRRQPGDLISILENEFAVLALPKQSLAICDGIEDRELYSAWLGCSQDQDANQCLQAFAESGIKGADWLVVDHYGLDSRWESKMLAGFTGDSVQPKLLVIDDLADRPHQADLLLDQNFFGDITNNRYEDLVTVQCTQLLGPHYSLLGPEYAQLHGLLPPRSELRRLFVFFGGVDPGNMTARTIEATLDPALADLQVDVVLGLQSKHRQLIERMVARRPNTNLYAPLPSLAGLIARADLAIGAGGATTWERACLGLPSLVVAIAANQVHFSQALDQQGHLQLLGDFNSVTTDHIRRALLEKITSFPCGEKAKALTDGWGASRVVIAMLGCQGSINLRSATSADENLLLRWANDLQVRANSFSPDSISSAEHHQWFQRSLKNSNRLQFIATTEAGCPIGQIRFDLYRSSLKGDASQAVVDLSIDRCARGHGLATELVQLGLQAMRHVWGNAVDAVAEVLPSNVASNKCFARAGFVPEAASSLPLDEPSGVIHWRWHSPPSL